MPALLFYTRPGCHLCERLESLLSPFLQNSRFTLTLIDIEEDPAAYDLYWSRIPVLVFNDRILLEGKPSEAEVNIAMSALLR